MSEFGLAGNLSFARVTTLVKNLEVTFAILGGQGNHKQGESSSQYGTSSLNILTLKDA